MTSLHDAATSASQRLTELRVSDAASLDPSIIGILFLLVILALLPFACTAKR